MVRYIFFINLYYLFNIFQFLRYSIVLYVAPDPGLLNDTFYFYNHL